MRRRLLNSAGVTLIELITTTVIISILSIVMVDFVTNWTKQHAVSQTRSELLSESQNSLDIVSDAARLSSGADGNNRWEDTNAPDAPGNLLSWQSDANTLVLASAVEDSNNEIIFSDALSYTSEKNNQIFFVSDGMLYRRIIAAAVSDNKLSTTCPTANASDSCLSDRRLAKNVRAFVVRYYNGDNQEVTPSDARSIEVTLTLGRSAYKQQIEESYTTRMVFRND